VKVLDETLEPSLVALLRFSLASSVFLPYISKQIYKNPSIVLSGISIGAFNSAGYLAQALALESSKSSNAAFISSMAVIVVPLLDFFSNDKAKKPFVDLFAPAILALIGTAILELQGASAPVTGDYIACIQPLMFGAGYWNAARALKQCNEPEEALAFTGSCIVAVAVMSIFWVLFSIIIPSLTQGGPPYLSNYMHQEFMELLNWQVIFALLWTGIMTTALTSFGENLAMKQLSAAESTVIFSSEPLWGTFFGSLILGESVGTNTFFGALFIIGACLWSQLAPARKAVI
jgi:drug/metabolite transporter (DMT)-like permease